jgi:4-hydroxy-tetrahydrodipicolinate synthase
MADWTKLVKIPMGERTVPAFLHGVITPMFTPCDENNKLDEAAIRAYTDYLIDMGSITTLFPRCGLGKMFDFQYDDIKMITDIIIDQAGDRIAVMPGTSGEYHRAPSAKPDAAAYIRESIELSQYAQKKGATACVLTAPEALVLADGVSAEDTIVDYFKTVCAEVDLPVIIYRFPGLDMTYEITPNILSRLLEIPNIAGMKYSTDHIATILRLTMRIPEDHHFGFISGDEIAYYQVIAMGGTGVIGQGCNTNPEVLRAVYDRIVEGDFLGAWKAQEDGLRCIEANTAPQQITGPGYRADVPVAGLMYAARKGVNVKAFTLEAMDPIPEEHIDHLEKELDAIRKPYLKG